MTTVRYHDIHPTMFPFSIDVYEYSDGTPLCHIDVPDAGPVSVPGYRRPVVVVCTYHRRGEVLVMGPPPDPRDPESEPPAWEFPI